MLTFGVIPALHVLESRWPVHEAWAAPSAAIVARPIVLRVWRQEFVVFHAAMDETEAAAFGALAAGASFGVVCERVALHVDPQAAATQAGSLLVRWIEDGLLTRFS